MAKTYLSSAPPEEGGLTGAIEGLGLFDNPAVFSLAQFQKFGPVSRVHLAGADICLLAGAAGMRVFYDETYVLRGPPAPESLMRTVWANGTALGLPPLDGAEHRVRKQNFLRTVAESQLETYMPVLDARLRAAVRSWTLLPKLPITPAADRDVLSMLAEVFFGAPLETGKAGDRIVRAVRENFSIFDRALPIDLPFDKYGRSRAAVTEVLYPYFQGIIERHRAHEESDAVGCYLRGAGAGFSDAEILTDLHQYFVGGYGVANAIPLLAYSLATHPQVVARLRAEIRAQRADYDAPFTLKSVRSFGYATSVVREVLRYWPMVPVVLGEAVKEIDIAGSRIAVGTKVMGCLYATCHDPAVFREPQLFDPSRFGKERNEGAADVEFAGYGVAFGAGSAAEGHACPGSRVALTMLTMAALVLAEHWCWELEDTDATVSLKTLPAGAQDDLTFRRVAPRTGKEARVHVVAGRDLIDPHSILGGVDPYVRVCTVEKGEAVPATPSPTRSGRTAKRKSTANPTWDQSLALECDTLVQPEVSVQVYDAGLLSDHLLGEFRLPTASADGIRIDYPFAGGTIAVAWEIGETIFAAENGPTTSGASKDETALQRTRARGQLLFENEPDDGARPIRNVRIQLWDLAAAANECMADGYTDKDGRFCLEYATDATAERLLDEPDLVLRVFDREYIYDKTGNVVSKWNVIASFDSASPHRADVDFGTLKVSFWPYENPKRSQSFACTPRVAVIGGHVPQGQSPGRVEAQIRAAASVLLAQDAQLLISKLDPRRPSTADIESAYRANRTRQLGLETSRSDDYISEMVLNGFNPCILQRNGDKYYVPFRWDGLEQDDKHFAPNTTAWFHVEGGALKLDGIEVQKRVGGDPSANARYEEPRMYTAKDPEWDRVKRLFRVNYFFFGEAVTHLADTHLNVEQYLVPIRRNVLRSPIAQLLLPHFQGTVAINLQANEILIADDGIIQLTSPATPGAIKAALVAAFGNLNWQGWKPRAPLCDQHRFAKLSALFWGVLDGYVADFFQKHDAEIRAHWPEIHAFSQELLAHALPFIDPTAANYYDAGEINDASQPHPVVSGTKVALSPITEKDEADEAGVANLRQLCTYLLYLVTFKHSWVNDLQYLMGGEIEFATLGVQGDITNLALVDETVIVPPREAIDHPFVTYVLNFTEYGYLLRNEDNDVNPDLIRALVRARPAFDALGYAIRNVRSTINI